jgi:hypothetical protein
VISGPIVPTWSARSSIPQTAVCTHRDETRWARMRSAHLRVLFLHAHTTRRQDHLK